MSELFFDGAKLKEQREKKGWSYERMADEISTPEHPMTSERVAELERMRSEIILEDVVDFCYSLWRKVKDLETLVNEQGSR